MGTTAAVAMPESVIEFGPLLDRIDELLRWAREHANRILAWGTEWVLWVGPLLHEFERLIQRLFDELKAMRDVPGNPVALWQTGNRWITEVGAVVGDRAGTFTADFMQSDNRWRGPAADAYLQALPPQAGALLKTGSITAAAGAALHEVAIAICLFWVALAAALAGLVPQLAAAVVAASTPLTVAAALTVAIACVAEFLTVAAGLLVALGNELRTMLTANSDLTRQLTDNSTFPDGHWPKAAVADLVDGSMSDGDGSDWSLRY